jgi:hypothetical protein
MKFPAYGVTEARSVEALAKMTQQILQLFDQFVAGAHSAIAEDGVSSPIAMDKIRENRQRLVQDTDKVLKRFRTKVGEREHELRAILHPCDEDYTEKAREAARQLYQIIEDLALKVKLSRRWQEQSASAIVAEYQETLTDGDIAKAEVFEAEAEWYLTQKGDPEATAKFLALRAEFSDARLTPRQQQAKAMLKDLERIKQEAALSMAFLTWGARVYGDPAPLSDQWRKEDRHDLDTVDMLGVSVALHGEGIPPVSVAVTDVSKRGLRVLVPRQFSPGTKLTLSLRYPGVTEGSVSFEAQVRWSEEDPNEPGRHEIGLQVVEGTESPWLDVFPKIVEQIEAYRALFNSPFNT